MAGLAFLPRQTRTTAFGVLPLEPHAATATVAATGAKKVARRRRGRDVRKGDPTPRRVESRCAIRRVSYRLRYAATSVARPATAGEPSPVAKLQPGVAG